MKLCLLGDLGRINDDFMDRAFEEYRVWTIASEEINRHLSKDIKVIRSHWNEKDLKAVFDRMQFDQILYFSSSLQYGNQDLSEVEKLRQLATAIGNRPFLYMLSSEDSFLTEVLVTTAKSLFKNVSFLYLPYRVDLTSGGDFFPRIFEMLLGQEEPVFFAPLGENIHLMDDRDLADLLWLLLDNQDEEWRDIVVTNTFVQNLSQLIEQMNQLRDIKTRVQLLDDGREARTFRTDVDHRVRRELGWFQQINVADYLEDYLREYRKMRKKGLGQLSGWKFLSGLSMHPKWLQAIEVVVLFGLIEGLQQLAQGSLQFRVIDFRLMFVLLVSMLYGRTLGFLAALLSGFSLVWLQLQSNQNLNHIFFNTEQWLPFVTYIIVAAICGFLRSQEEDTFSKMEARKNEVERENALLIEAFETSADENAQLKEQILSRKDGFTDFYTAFEALKEKPSLSRLGRLVGQELQTSQVSFVAEAPLTMNQDFWVNRQLDASLPDVVIRLQDDLYLSASKIPWDRLNDYRLNRVRMMVDMAQYMLEEGKQ